MQLRFAVTATLVAPLVFGTLVCAASRAEVSRSPVAPAGVSELELQELVMEMADDYIAALGEAIYLMPQEARTEPRTRWLTQSFLRNGVGAAMDIASGPKPDVAILDMVVLATLQTWAFESRWTSAGIDAEQAASAARVLRRAEERTWRYAARVLNEDQRSELRGLIDNWIEANPEHVVVSFVRFHDFTDEQMVPNAAERRRASGLLGQVRNATVAVDNARLFGERALWFAGRYPYLLGEQAELTAYRLADQPEFRELSGSLDEVKALSRSVSSLLDRLDEEEQTAIDRAEASLKRVSQDIVDRSFDRLATERSVVLDELEARQGELGSVLNELRLTIEASSTLTATMTETFGSLDHLLGRFDADPNSGREPLDLVELRDTIAEAARMTEATTLLLERTHETLLSDAWDERLDDLSAVSGGLVDRAFLRGLALVAVLLVGLALLRLIPVRTTRMSSRQ